MAAIAVFPGQLIPTPGKMRDSVLEVRIRRSEFVFFSVPPIMTAFQ
jgi:hypothetical protein